MGLGDCQYWLKGGVALCFFIAAVTVLAITFIPACRPECIWNPFLYPLLLLSLITPPSLSTPSFVSYVFAVLFYFAIGAFIGFVYEKVKQQRLSPHEESER